MNASTFIEFACAIACLFVLAFLARAARHHFSSRDRASICPPGHLLEAKTGAAQHHQ